LPLSLSTSVCGFGLKAHIEILPTFGEESVKESFFVICIESEQKIVRVLTSDVAIVDDLWTVTGARDAAGKELRPIKGTGFEAVQKIEGRWRFVATRQKVIFKSN
jgi:hypothetical protein